MSEEIQSFLSDDFVSRSIADREFHLTKIGDQEVVVLQSGVGKVAAAIATTILCHKFECRTIVNVGVAGGLTMSPGREVLIAERIVPYDYGRSNPKGLTRYRPGTLPIPGEEGKDNDFHLNGLLAETMIPTLGTDARLGVMASGDRFVNDDNTRKRLKAMGADAVDMEAAAVAQTAEAFFAQWIIVKGISDEANGQSHKELMEQTEAAAEQAAKITKKLIPLFKA